MIFRSLKGLEDFISVSVVHWYMAEDGWTFKPDEGVVADPVNGAEYMHQVYTAAVPDYTGRVTVPVLWDKKTNTINMFHIKHRYYVSHTTINPSGVVPVGPDSDLLAEHDRNKFQVRNAA